MPRKRNRQKRSEDLSRRGFLKGSGTGAVAAGDGPTILGSTDKADATHPIVGSGDHTYEVIHNWGELPKHIRYGNTHGVRIDRDGFVYVHHTVHASSETGDSMVIFDPQGKFVKSWGKEFQGGAHGLHVQKEGNEEFLYMCDIRRNIVVKTTLDGREVFTLGYPKESEAYQGITYTPTNLAVAPNGDIYVGDGYGSSHVIQYNKDGEYVRTFGGGKTKEPGDLNSPHGITMDHRGAEPYVLVADRSNNRLQYFALDGKHVKFSYGVHLPCHFDWYGDEMLVPDLAARVTILDRDDKVIVHLGEGPDDWKERRQKSRNHFLPGKFVCPHGACYDHAGNIFVVEWVEIGRVTKLRKVA